MLITVACIFASIKRKGKINSKAIILIGAIGTLAVILLRKVRGYADMAQQITFVPKVYDIPKSGMFVIFAKRYILCYVILSNLIYILAMSVVNLFASLI